MNYFAHALNHVDSPYFMAGTAIPDWLSVADRKVRMRPRLLDPWLHADDPIQAALASGVARHLADDDWFHATRGFVEVTGELTRMFRELVGQNENYHCGFLGHVGMEMLLDAVLIQDYPSHFEDYWQSLASIDPDVVQTAVNRMARVPAERLSWFIEIFRREQFLRDYATDARLLRRLNQVLRRVKLEPIPMEAEQVLCAGRNLVREQIRDLLPEEHFSMP